MKIKGFVKLIVNIIGENSFSFGVMPSKTGKEGAEREFCPLPFCTAMRVSPSS